jgi:hypothetical protein
MTAVFLKDAMLTNKRTSQLANFIFPLIHQWIFSFMLFLKMVFVVTLFYYRNASVTEKTNHLNCIFTKEVFAAPDIITNSAFITNFNVMFQLSVLILSWCTTYTSDSQLWTKFHWSKAYYIVHSSRNTPDFAKRNMLLQLGEWSAMLRSEHCGTSGPTLTAISPTSLRSRIGSKEPIPWDNILYFLLVCNRHLLHVYNSF